MFKKYLISSIIILFYFSDILASYQSQLDSLNFIIENEVNKKKQLESLIAIVEFYRPSEVNKIVSTLDKINQPKYEEFKSEALKAQISLIESYLFLCTYENDKAKILLDSISPFILKKGSDHLKSRYYAQIGRVAFYTDLRQSLIYYEKSIEFCAKKYELGRILNGKGHAAFNLGVYSTSISSFKKSLDIAIALKDTIGIDHCYHNLGKVYIQNDDKENGLKFLYKSYDLGKLLNDTLSMLISCSTISNYHIEYAEYKQADILLQRGKYLNNFVQNPFYTVKLYLHNGKLYLKQKQFDLALQEAKYALKMAKKYDFITLKVEASILLSQILIHQNKEKEALSTLNNIWSSVIKNGSTSNTKIVTELLIKLHKKTKNNGKLAYYYPIYMEARDSLLSLNNTKIINQIKYELEVEKKDADIALFKEKEENQKSIYIYVSLLLAISLITLFALFLYSRRMKKIVEQEILLKEKEKKQRAQRTNLFANLSHEFRTPLSLIKTPLDEMLSKTFKGNKEEALMVMSRNAGRLLNLTNQMLDLSKLEEGNIHIKSEKTDLSNLIKKEIINYSSLATSKTIELEFYYPQEELFVSVDKKMFLKILHNLISNAFKFTSPNGLISLRLVPKVDLWQFIIKDSGKGIPEEEIPYIFNRYYRGVLEKNHVEIGGLGLALIKEYMDILNGKIAVESNTNLGTTFTLSFPYDKGHIPTLKKVTYEKYKGQTYSISPIDSEITQTPLPPSILSELKKPPILIIEDNKELNQMMFDRLTEDYHVFQAFDGKEGLKIATENLPLLIISDIMMPIMNGVEFSKQLELIPEISHIPVIIVSALDKHLDNQKLWEQGIVDFMIKPVDYKILKHKINNILKNRELFKKQLFSIGWNSLKTNKSTISNKDREFLNCFISIIENNYTNPNFELSNLTKKMNMSRTSIFNKVKALTGVSPIVFLNKTRLHKAKNMMTKENIPINEVAINVGIPNHAYFSKNFKKEFGVSPRNYMKRKE